MAENRDYMNEEHSCEHHEHEHHEHHDHEHEHSHHEHDHHDHHHDHDHGPVHISHHEGAVIGAMKGVIPEKDYDKAEKLLAGKMKEAGARITEAGGIIGHIKFIITESGRCGQISVTDVDEYIKHFESETCSIEGVAIVFAVEDELLKTILTETIGSILANNQYSE